MAYELGWSVPSVEELLGLVHRRPVLRLVVAGSFDAFSWQTVARKGTFIDQIMRGTSAREIEDVSDETLQAHQIKAIAAGTPC
ncbi:hypothetical protein ACIBEF_32010 [Micromonospora sp. NPDC050795]|uniref:hypothetical protein n=1 Tax=Micromonospora sp. NPDC050795 TaxID=3364282 RepID=UPI0037A59F9B